MAGGRPKPALILDGDERAALHRLVRRGKVAQRTALRARIVLACAAGGDNRSHLTGAGMSEKPAEQAAYDLASEPLPRAVLPAAGGVAPKPLAYRPPRADALSDPDVVKNLYMPLWLLGGGVAVEVLAVLIRGPSAKGIFAVGINLIAGTALMLVGILLAARWRGIDLGGFWTAVFKLAAISVAPSAAVTLATPVLRFIPLGGLLGWAAEFVLYFALLGALFDLDQSDTWYCVLVIFLVRVAVYFALLGIVLKWG